MKDIYYGLLFQDPPNNVALKWVVRGLFIQRYGGIFYMYFVVLFLKMVLEVVFQYGFDCTML